MHNARLPRSRPPFTARVYQRPAEATYARMLTYDDEASAYCDNVIDEIECEDRRTSVRRFSASPQGNMSVTPDRHVGAGLVLRKE
jgi:hypothetical protein